MLNFENSKICSNPFITHDNKNKITKAVADWDFCNQYNVEIIINGATVYSQKVFAASIRIIDMLLSIIGGLIAFDTYATAEERDELKQLFADKKIDLNTIHSGIHTSWGNAEKLVRSMYFGCHDAKEKYGIEPKTVFSPTFQE